MMQRRHECCREASILHVVRCVSIAGWIDDSLWKSSPQDRGSRWVGIRVCRVGFGTAGVSFAAASSDKVKYDSELKLCRLTALPIVRLGDMVGGRLRSCQKFQR